jgi:hypothetical protein
MSLEPTAALGLDLFKLVERAEDPIGERLIGERPQTFGWLQLRRMRWQKEQMQSFGNHKITAFVPACLIENEKDVLVWPSPLLLDEGSKSKRKGRCVDGRHEQPGSLSALWLHKTVEVHPLIARSDQRPDPASFPRPGATQDRFEANAMFILTPQFNLSVWIRLMLFLDLLWEFF